MHHSVLGHPVYAYLIIIIDKVSIDKQYFSISSNMDGFSKCMILTARKLHKVSFDNLFRFVQWIVRYFSNVKINE